MAPTLSDVAATLASLYISGPDLSLTDQQRASFLMSTERAFARLPYTVTDAPTDPGFSGPAAMLTYIGNTGTLPVYSGHPPSYWTRRENWMLRAVHDHHHLDTMAGFDFAGEIKAFSHQASQCDDPIHRAILFSEVVLQASYHHVHGQFPVQRLVRCSDELIQSAVKLGEAF